MPHSFEGPAEAPDADPGPTHWVNMRWQSALGWAVTTVFCLYIAVGMTVATIVSVIAVAPIAGTMMLLALAVIFGLLSWPLVRMTPRYSTRQGVSVDGTGITLAQEPKRWFPGRSAHIPWPQIRGISRDRIVTSSGDSRTVRYVVDIELNEPLRDPQPPGWAAVDGGRVRVQARKARQEEILQALRATRPDLFADG
ncbi:hypothetical protein [Actinomadura sp. 9N407]|uniref:hypothetical protein n=1 Tax=Actinomadura sp. 9N407 TaxID=3375154 RepID=UPI0037A1F26B